MTISRFALVAHLADRFAVDISDAVEQRRAGSRYPVTRYVSGDVVIEIANSADGQRRLRLEASGRSWANRHGIETPEVLDIDVSGDWMVSRWVHVDAVSGEDYVSLSIDAARRIARGQDLSVVSHEASSWRAPTLTKVTRGARSAAGGVPLRLWFATRAQMARLNHPLDVAHGDYYPRNVLGSFGKVIVVDWEYAGLFPRHSDLARMWSVLRSRNDRDQVLSAALEGADRAERTRVATLLLWHSLRLLGENLSAPPSQRDPSNLAHARRMVPEARELALGFDAWPL